MDKLIDYSNAIMLFAQKLGNRPDVLRINFAWIDGITIAGLIEDDPNAANAIYIPDSELVQQNPPEYFKPEERRMKNKDVLAARIAEVEILYNILKLSGA